MNKLLVGSVSNILKITGFLSNSLAVSFAFRLFCHPSVRSKLRDSEKAFMSAAQRDTIDINGQTLQVYHWGDSVRPILLMHGWESRGSRFSSLMTRLLTDGYSPVTYDLPGHGESQGSSTTIVECNQICEELGRKFGKFEAVIGHSFGVPCAMYALKNSISSDRIVAISGLSDFRYLVDQFCRVLCINDKVGQGLANRIEQLFIPTDDIWNRFSVGYQAEKLVQPILVIHDKHDDIVMIDQGRKIAAHFDQQARLIETEGLGHRRVLDSELVVNTIVEFLRENQGQFEHHEQTFSQRLSI